MFDALRFAQGINLVVQRPAIIGPIHQEPLQRLERRTIGPGQRRIDFNPVAGRKDYRLFGQAGRAQPLQCLRDFRLREGKPLPHLDGRGVMAQADDDDGHGQKLRMISDDWATSG